jgi:hypothetical protein
VSLCLCGSLLRLRVVAALALGGALQRLPKKEWDSPQRHEDTKKGKEAARFAREKSFFLRVFVPLWLSTFLPVVAALALRRWRKKE